MTGSLFYQWSEFMTSYYVFWFSEWFEVEWVMFDVIKSEDLINFVFKQNEEGVQKAIASGADVQYKNNVALVYAARIGSVKIAKCLLLHGAEKNSQWKDCLSEAAFDGHYEMVEFMLSLGVYDQDSLDAALRDASTKGFLNLVDLLLKKCANPNGMLKMQAGFPLLNASVWGHHQIVRYLLEMGANVSLRDNAALLYASMKGYVEVVKILLEFGASVKTEYSNSPLYEAINYGHLSIVELLVNDCVLDDEVLRLALRRATHLKAIDIAISLINSGVNIEVLDEKDEFLPQLITTLLDKEFKLASDKFNLAWAAKFGYFELFKRLLPLRQTILSVDDFNSELLAASFNAASKDYTKIFRTILGLGVVPPLSYTFKEGCVALLLETDGDNSLNIVNTYIYSNVYIISNPFLERIMRWSATHFRPLSYALCLEILLERGGATYVVPFDQSYQDMDRQKNGLTKAFHRYEYLNASNHQSDHTVKALEILDRISYSIPTQRNVSILQRFKRKGYAILTDQFKRTETRLLGYIAQKVLKQNELILKVLIQGFYQDGWRRWSQKDIALSREFTAKGVTNMFLCIMPFEVLSKVLTYVLTEQNSTVKEPLELHLLRASNFLKFSQQANLIAPLQADIENDINTKYSYAIDKNGQLRL